ncbi:hypothetical protein AVEN_46231-1 [Araneus ventricosus]|uniref:Uncharacterized protein n=1 Tax=Araneus ventricosus TaxID=182803 RepID=A0A4Y2VN93_ARAVE|nr:hypothetical protein AVEN_46231-1 [Araneus ventricosus]
MVNDRRTIVGAYARLRYPLFPGKLESCPQKPLNRKSFPTAPANAWPDPAALAKVKEIPKSDSNIKPVTQFVPRPLDLSHKMKSSQEEFVKQMSTMMTSFISQMDKFHQRQISKHTQ